MIGRVPQPARLIQVEIADLRCVTYYISSSTIIGWMQHRSTKIAAARLIKLQGLIEPLWLQAGAPTRRRPRADAELNGMLHIYRMDVGASLAIKPPVSLSIIMTHQNSTSHGSAEGTKGHVDTIRLLVLLLT